MTGVCKKKTGNVQTSQPSLVLYLVSCEMQSKKLMQVTAKRCSDVRSMTGQGCCEAPAGLAQVPDDVQRAAPRQITKHNI